MHSLALFLLQEQPDPAMVQKMAMIMIPVILGAIIIGIIILIVPCWFILKKAGFTPWLSLLCLLPSLGLLVLLYVLAFAEWKVVPAPQQAWQPPVPPQA